MGTVEAPVERGKLLWGRRNTSFLSKKWVADVTERGLSMFVWTEVEIEGDEKPSGGGTEENLFRS